MRAEHCERIQPICPVCWTSRQSVSVLKIGRVARQDGDEILEGTLNCGDRMCQREHPIIDGIPVVLVNPASWIESQLPYVLRRRDLTDFTESILGDLAGPGSAFDRERGNNGIYGQAHWGGDDSEEPSFLGLFRAAGDLLSKPPGGGLWLDIGCSVGRGAFELARQTGDLAVGVDLNFSMLRIADEIRRTGRIRYATRRVGIAFDAVDDPAPPGLPADRVSFWCTEAAMLPFAAGAFQGALALNMLDCVPSPLSLLCDMGRVLAPGSEAILATPFDWAVGASPAAAWIGGHSQRGPQRGSSVAELRRILSSNRDAGLDTGLHIEAEADGVPWRLRTAERAVTEYSVFLARLRRGS